LETMKDSSEKSMNWKRKDIAFKEGKVNRYEKELLGRELLFQEASNRKGSSTEQQGREGAARKIGLQIRGIRIFIAKGTFVSGGGLLPVGEKEMQFFSKKREKCPIARVRRKELSKDLWKETRLTAFAMGLVNPERPQFLGDPWWGKNAQRNLGKKGGVETNVRSPIRVVAILGG